MPSIKKAPTICQATPKSKSFARKNEHLPLPALRGERVGVRRTLRRLKFADSPLTRRYAPTSPLKWGEVTGNRGLVHGLLHRPVPDRSCQRSVAVSGRLGAVDHLRRDADREFRARRVLYARRLRRVFADRSFLRCVRILGRHHYRRPGCCRGRRAGRDGAVAADLSLARIVSIACDLWPDPDGRGPRGADLGPERTTGPPCARLQRRGRLLRPEHPEL